MKEKADKKSQGKILKRDEADITTLLEVFTAELMINPFAFSEINKDECQPLLNISTGVIVPNDAAERIVNADVIG